MFHVQKPDLIQLPSTAQLIRSTLIAALSAIVILFTVVFPAEYAIDPTGIGRSLGLTEMGEIKKELSKEAEVDRKLDEPKKEEILKPKNNQSKLFQKLFNIFDTTANAQEVENWRDNTQLIIQPGATAEWKLTMLKGQVVEYQVIVEGGGVLILIFMDMDLENQKRMKRREVDQRAPRVGLLLHLTANMVGFFVTETKQVLALPSKFVEIILTL